MVNFSNHLDFDALAQSAIIDLRENAQFLKLHLIYSCNITASTIESRLHELPDRRRKVSIVGDKDSLTTVETLLVKKGYEILFKLESSVFFATYKKYNWFESGDTNNRLWKPSSVVDIFVDKYAKPKLANKEGDIRPFTGIDLACGAGRDSIFMAVNHWKITAVDYLSSALERVDSLAKNNNCRVQTVKLNLEKINPSGDAFEFPEEWKGYFDLVIVSRYLHRPLLKHLDSLIKADGFIIYQTFLEGCEKFGSPKNPRYLLKRGELANIFSNYDILLDEIEALPDGRPTNIFIAQK